MTAPTDHRFFVRVATAGLGRPVALGAGGTVLVALLIAVAAWAFMVWDWERGRTITFSIAGILPISDAAGYYGCANGLLDLGRFADHYAGWCDHRPIYLGLLALPPLTAVGPRCAPGETSSLARLGRDSVVLAVAGEGAASVYPTRLPARPVR